MDGVGGPGAIEAERQASLRRALPKEHFSQRGAACLAGIVIVQQGRNAVDPGHRVDSATGGDHDDGVLVDGRDSADQRVLSPGQFEAAIKAFAFGRAVEANTEDNGIGGCSNLERGRVDQIALATNAEGDTLAAGVRVIDESEVNGLACVQDNGGGLGRVTFAMRLIE